MWGGAWGQVQGRLKVTLPGWVCLEPKVSWLPLEMKADLSHWPGGSDLASLGRTVPFLMAGQLHTTLCKQRRVWVLLDSLLRAHTNCGTP